MKRLSLMVTEPLFERVELARGDVPRERWLRRAVEQALGETPLPIDHRVPMSPAPAEQPRMLVRSEADAERDLEDALSDAPRFRHSGPYDAAVSRREFRPYPKGGK